MSDSRDSELGVAFTVAEGIRNITKYYKKATENLFDEAGKPNDPTTEAVIGSLKIRAARDVVLQSKVLGSAAFLSIVWTTVESAQESFRSAADQFEAKVEEVKAMDSGWNEIDRERFQKEARSSEMYRLCSELIKTFEHVPTMRSFKRLRATESPLDTDAADLAKFEYTKLESPQDTIRLVRMDTRSDSLKSPIIVTTRTVRLEDADSYATLSYTWGNPFGIFRFEKERDTLPRTDMPILCDGKRLDIGENLYNFLRRWRQALVTTEARLKENPAMDMPQDARPPTEFWIDAISINQKDIEEKNSQVSMMGDIYAKSSRTWVWLGEEDEFSRPAMAILVTLASQVSEDDIESLKALEREDLLMKLGLPDASSWKWFALFAFFQRQWFRRSWVVQEAALSSEILLQCGSMLMPWSTLSGGFLLLTLLKLLATMVGIGMTEMQNMRHEVRMIESNSKRRAVLKSAPEPSAMRFHPCREGLETNVGGMVTFISRIKRLDPHIDSADTEEDHGPVDSRLRFLELWGFSRTTLCGDPRDKVYALASLANRDLYRTEATADVRRQLSPDYNKSVSEAYCEMAWFTLLTQGDLGVLSMTAYVPDDIEHNKHDLPSWVPDLTYSNRVLPLAFVLRRFPGLEWLAAGDARWDIPPPDMTYERHLHVKAIIIGTVQDTDDAEPSFKEGERFKFDYKKALEFAKRIPASSSGRGSGQTQFEVLWRTIIADFAGGVSPAPAEYAAEFERLYLQAFKQASDDFGMRNVQHFDFILSMSDMWDLGRLKKDDGLSEAIERMDINTSETADFRERLFNTMGNRRLFVSDSGHVGCGDTNLSVGDSVVVLAGSSIPFILRFQDDGNYKLIGEAYVHGIMFGEAAKPDAKWEPITLE